MCKKCNVWLDVKERDFRADLVAVPLLVTRLRSTYLEIVERLKHASYESCGPSASVLACLISGLVELDLNFMCRRMCEHTGKGYCGIATTGGKVRWAVAILLGLLSFGLVIGYIVEANKCGEVQWNSGVNRDGTVPTPPGSASTKPGYPVVSSIQ